MVRYSVPTEMIERLVSKRVPFAYFRERRILRIPLECYQFISLFQDRSIAVFPHRLRDQRTLLDGKATFLLIPKCSCGAVASLWLVSFGRGEETRLVKTALEAIIRHRPWSVTRQDALNVSANRTSKGTYHDVFDSEWNLLSKGHHKS